MDKCMDASPRSWPHVRMPARTPRPSRTYAHPHTLTYEHAYTTIRTPPRTHARNDRMYARTHALPSARPPARPVQPTPSPVTHSRGGGRRAGVEVGEEVAKVSGRERWDLYGNRDGHIDGRGVGWGGRVVG